jgi:hypothetical protein
MLIWKPRRGRAHDHFQPQRSLIFIRWDQRLWTRSLDWSQREAGDLSVPHIAANGLRQNPVDQFPLASSPHKRGPLVADLSMRHRGRAATTACWYGSPLARGGRRELFMLIPMRQDRMSASGPTQPLVRKGGRTAYGARAEIWQALRAVTMRAHATCEGRPVRAAFLMATTNPGRIRSLAGRQITPA